LDRSELSSPALPEVDARYDFGNEPPKNRELPPHPSTGGKTNERPNSEPNINAEIGIV
jgi:hypothetical protein